MCYCVINMCTKTDILYIAVCVYLLRVWSMFSKMTPSRQVCEKSLTFDTKKGYFPNVSVLTCMSGCCLMESEQLFSCIMAWTILLYFDEMTIMVALYLVWLW